MINSPKSIWYREPNQLVGSKYEIYEKVLNGSSITVKHLCTVNNHPNLKLMQGYGLDASEAENVSRLIIQIPEMTYLLNQVNTLNSKLSKSELNKKSDEEKILIRNIGLFLNQD